MSCLRCWTSPRPTCAPPWIHRSSQGSSSTWDRSGERRGSYTHSSPRRCTPRSALRAASTYTRTAARSLVTTHPVPPPDVVVQLARHCALAGLASEALDWSVRAGNHAFAHLAPIEAARHFGVALDIAEELDRPDTERADLLVRLGDAQQVAGDPQALATLEMGAELAGRTGNRETLIRAVLAADRGFMRLDSGAPSYLAMVEAAVAAADPTDTTNYAQLLAILAQSLTYTPRAERRTAFAHQALALAEATDSPILLAQVGPAVVSALWGPGTTRLRGRVAARVLTAAEATGDPRLQFSARRTAYNVAVESADPIVAAHSLAGIRSAVRSLGEPRLRWIAGLVEAFDAMMTGRLDESQSIAAATLDLGLQIGVPDAFAFFAAQFFVIGTFAGRHDELFPLVEQVRRDNPEMLAFDVAYGIICAAVDRRDEARGILNEGMADGFAELPRDNIWMTSIIGYAVLAIELDDVDAAAQLLPVIEPYAGEVAFNGITSQGPIAAYVGKLASLLGRHDLAEDYLRSALATAEAFGWTYHRATTLFALAQGRHRRLGELDAEGRLWLSEAAKLCQAYGFRSWKDPNRRPGRRGRTADALVTRRWRTIGPSGDGFVPTDRKGARWQLVFRSSGRAGQPSNLIDCPRWCSPKVPPTACSFMPSGRPATVRKGWTSGCRVTISTALPARSLGRPPPRRGSPPPHVREFALHGYFPRLIWSDPPTSRPVPGDADLMQVEGHHRPRGARRCSRRGVTINGNAHSHSRSRGRRGLAGVTTTGGVLRPEGFLAPHLRRPG